MTTKKYTIYKIFQLMWQIRLYQTLHVKIQLSFAVDDLSKEEDRKNSNIFRSTWLCFFFVSGIPGCGGLLTAPNGQFSSPQHPETYANNLDCEWLIRVPQGDRIELNFLSFDLERHTTYLWVLQLNLVFLMWIRQIVL